MNKIWKFTPSFPREFAIERMSSCFSVYVESSLRDAGRSRGIDDIVGAQLAINIENFDADCFQWDSCIFVSERMRNAMSLDVTAIQFFDVDASDSAPLPRSLNYKAMSIPVTEEISDPSKSNYMSPEIYPGGPIGSVLRFPQLIALRSDVQPMHDLFLDSFFGEPFCTDYFALRLLQANCTGVLFIDPNHMTCEHVRFRTLRGVEEEVQSRFRRQTRTTKVVEPLSNTHDVPQGISAPQASR
jgi:hypothetical protein